MRISYEEVTVKVELDRSDETKTIFNYQIDIAGDLDEAKKQIVLNMVKNCPVKKTLSKPLEFIMNESMSS
ncbi:OsmC family protein [Paenibacillus sp. ISL-20]|uniref:OsmC family protein n=1 Tax=Paenibacillus sp. ISL-20 TaxID=2819163 RepID=UPI001BEB2CE9|nr:OsmC family protein [Paenibacillus sp. ISL-20]MBT2764391.1 OsmC family protein [Paenibacillus sp. ISL-20]